MSNLTDHMIELVVSSGGGGFSPEEFLEGREHLQTSVVEEMVAFRNWEEIISRDLKIQITSAFRTYGSHQFGLALDFLLWKVWREQQPEDIMSMWRLVTTWPWHGVGIYFDWKDGIGFHVDLLSPPTRQRPLRWLRINGLYYYQSINDGCFYHKRKGKTTLQEQIKRYHARSRNT